MSNNNQDAERATYAAIMNRGNNGVMTDPHTSDHGPVGRREPNPSQQQQKQGSRLPILFFKNRDVVNYNDKNDTLPNEEVYVELCKTIRCETIEGVQRIGGLWRLYITDPTARCKLLVQGINIRGRNIFIYEHNPFLRTANTVLLRVCDVPLSVHDCEIVNAVRHLGAEIIGDCQKEKLRVNGKLVNCLTGNRRLEIKIPRDPLPRYAAINDFKAKLFHYGQPETKDVICSNCHDKGHYIATCRNKTRCSLCRQEGHTKDSCPTKRTTKTQNSTPKLKQKDKTPVSSETKASSSINNPSEVSPKKRQVLNSKPEIQSQSPITTEGGKKHAHSYNSCESSDSDADSISEDDTHELLQYSSVSAKSPSEEGTKRKLKESKQKRGRRRRKSNGH